MFYLGKIRIKYNKILNNNFLNVCYHYSAQLTNNIYEDNTLIIFIGKQAVYTVGFNSLF